MESLEQVDALLSQISTAWVEPPNLELCIFAPYVFLERARNKLPKLGRFHGSREVEKGGQKGVVNNKEVEGVTGTSSKRGPWKSGSPAFFVTISLIFPSVFMFNRQVHAETSPARRCSQGKTSPWGVKMPGMQRKALDAPVW